MTYSSPAAAPPAPATPPTNKNGVATASLVLGIISIFVNPFLLTSIAGIITGIIGAVRSPFGRTKAIIGIVLSVVGAIIGIIVMSLIFGAIGAASSAVASSDAQQSQVATAGPQSGESAAPTKVAANVPAGYADIGDGVFFKFGTKSTDSIGDTTYNYTVIASQGCPNSFYVEANELNQAGDNVGFTNDTAGSITKGGKYLGKFMVTDSGVKSLKITKETCY